MRQTDFSNDEAVGFLADRLNRLGVEARLLEQGAQEGDAVIIGALDNAVVFDFKPGVDAGAEALGRRGEDHRLEESRPAARRRREIDAAMPERSEGETRADVARRFDRPDFGPRSYEIGSAGRPRPGRERPAPMTRSAGDRRPPDRGQGRVVVADESRGWHRCRTDAPPGRRTRRGAGPWCRGGAGLLRGDRRRAGAAGPRPSAAGASGAAGCRLGGSGTAGAPVHRGAVAARHRGRPGAAHRRRRDPALALPQRLPDLREAARARACCRS